MSRPSPKKDEDIDTDGVFIDFESGETSSNASGFEEDEDYPDYSSGSAFSEYGDESVEGEKPLKTLTETLLGLTWQDPAYSKVLWDHDIRLQAKCAPDIKLAVKHILGVPVGEAAEEKVFGYGQSISNTNLLDEIIKFRMDPALMRGAIYNPYASKETLLYIQRAGVQEEDKAALASTLDAFNFAEEVLSKETSLKDCSQSLLTGKNAVALKILEEDDDFDVILELLASKENSELRKAFISISNDPDMLLERYLLDYDLNVEEVDLDMIHWLVAQDDMSMAKAMVLSDTIGEFGISAAKRMSDEAAWWCAFSHDEKVRALACNNPGIRSVMNWANPPLKEKPKHRDIIKMQSKIFDPDAFRTKVSSLLLTGLTPEAVSYSLCHGNENLPDEEAIDLVAMGDTLLILSWLSGQTKIPVLPGSVQTVLGKLNADKLQDLHELMKRHYPDILTKFAWSMEMFLLTPDTCSSLSEQQGIWARAYIENAIGDHDEKAALLKSVLDSGDTWSGSIVELVTSLYPGAKGIPTPKPVEEELYFD